MIFGKYDSYKDSGVEWIEEIPSDWKVKRIKDIIVKIGSGVTPKGGSEIYPVTGIPFLRSQNVYDEGLELDGVALITEEINEKMKSSQIKPNDILLNITGASIGRTCIVPDSLKKANINQHIAFIRLKNKTSIDFFSLYLKSHFLKEYIFSQQNGASKEAFNLAQITVIPILDFENNYSRLISNFLDKKTSQIDKKIKLLQGKKESYEELKKSLINETVCRGINKNVELKESGIEWIGKIPKHWKFERLKDQFSLISSGIYSFKEKKEYLSTKSISINKIEKIEETITFKKRPSRANMQPIINSVWFAKLRFTKKSYLFDDLEETKKYILSTGFAGLRTKSVNSKFVNYYFCSEYFFYQKDSVSYGTTQEAITEPSINQIIFIFPPEEEQLQIANYLDEKTSKIDKIILKINDQVETLKEFRKTLINDVVTGKVRIQDE